MLRTKPEAQAQREKEEYRNVSECLVAALDPSSTAAENYRTLRTSLLYGLVDTHPKTIMLTSPGSAEGKSTVCANLGVVLAQADKNTLIVDCDFRKPMMREIFGIANTWGTTNLLMGECTLQQAYQEPLPNLGLKMLTSGPLPPNPGELLSSSGRLPEFLASVREEFDYVLIDSSPIGLVSEPAILATQVDGVLLILDARKTSKGDVQRAMHSLVAVGANVLGTVLNNLRS